MSIDNFTFVPYKQQQNEHDDKLIFFSISIGICKLLQKTQKEIHLRDWMTEGFSSPNKISKGIKRNISKTSSELFPSLFSFVPQRTEIPAEIAKITQWLVTLPLEWRKIGKAGRKIKLTHHLWLGLWCMTRTLFIVIYRTSVRYRGLFPPLSSHEKVRHGIRSVAIFPC